MNLSQSTNDQALIESVIEVLNQGETLLAEIENNNYIRKLPGAFNASIGGHYRHCLDHFRSLLESATAGELNYDHRERGTLVESDRFAALNATRELRTAYQQLSVGRLSRELLVTCKTSYATSSSQTAPSSIGREIMYVVAHAVHHYALIGIMGGMLGFKLPRGFGVAPSTAKFQSDLSKTQAESNCSP